MLDHVGYPVTDYARSKAFYTAALAPLGYTLFREITPEMSGVITGKPAVSDVHIAFRAADRATVDAFHKAAIAAGGTDNGAPGMRPHYHQDYYGAFVLDPDGNNVEAVCHAPG
jgi:catechol 2,3-dioxygenase-like lactoylglutathione lyase family enzyme